jgi:hypothetical protein
LGAYSVSLFLLAAVPPLALYAATRARTVTGEDSLAILCRPGGLLPRARDLAQAVSLLARDAGDVTTPAIIRRARGRARGRVSGEIELRLLGE